MKGLPFSLPAAVALVADADADAAATPATNRKVATSSNSIHPPPSTADPCANTSTLIRLPTDTRKQARW
uniref:Uncharacterized protein n=1 Tax=Oryza punctata TaxID=4537 RepID=A0A0E0MM20_ORYPU